MEERGDPVRMADLPLSCHVLWLTLVLLASVPRQVALKGMLQYS